MNIKTIKKINNQTQLKEINHRFYMACMRKDYAGEMIALKDYYTVSARVNKDSPNE